MQVQEDAPRGARMADDPVSDRPGLDRLFHPKSVAIVGASGRAGNPFARPLHFLCRYDFAGDIFPVNPNYEELAGLTCYPSLEEVPAPVDLVLSMVPAAQTIDLVRECGRLGVGAVIIFASGFAETGEAGRARQDELAAAAVESGVRVIGPNCQGVVNVANNLVATFSAAAEPGLPNASGIAYVGQSGAVGGSVLDLARETGMGLSAWVSTGNQADTDLVEVGEYLVEDPEIQVLMLYLESITDGVGYERLARRVRQLGKHLVVLRSGRSNAGRRAVASHTGAMLSHEVGFDLVSRQEGAVIVDDVDELLRTAFALRSVPLPRGDRVAIVTTSGGAGSLAADQLEARGMVVEELSGPTQRELASVIPDFGATANPVDVTAQLFSRGEHAFRDVCLAVGRDRDVDIVMVLVTMVIGQAGARLATDIVEVADMLDKPLLVTWLAGEQQTADGRQVYRDHGLPIFASVGDAAHTAAALVGRARAGKGQVAQPGDHGAHLVDVDRLAAAITGPLLLEAEAAGVLDAIGVPYPPSVLATTRSEAEQAARSFDRPLAMKVHVPGLLHKTDVGGVRLGVTPGDAGTVFDQLLATPGNGVEGVLVAPMADGGQELILGVTSSEHGFPPVLTLGFGGVATELYRDITSRLLPIDAAGAAQMLRELKAWPLLDGYRGRAHADVDALVDVVVRVSTAVGALDGRLLELEINPLIVHDRGEGVTAVDFMMRTTTTEGEQH